MVVVENPNDYSFVMFEKSQNPSKKYDAVLYNKKAKKYKRVPFGDVNYQQYEDKTGLGLYSHLNHYDKERRRLYKNRHKGEDRNKFSSGFFSMRFLW
jgi:hypothetical protein